jgi:uncharacterized membrane protein YhaH (DUF805 family)
MGTLRRWLLVAVLVCLADILVLQATGNGNSGAHDSAFKILGFWVFVLSAVASLVMAVLLVVRRFRLRRP